MNLPVQHISGPQARTGRNKVLLVEDSELQRRILRGFLESGGYEVHEASNGYEALEEIEGNFDLRFVITDLSMPVMDGFQLIKAIRDFEPSGIFIIVTTASEDDDSLNRSFKLGANDYLKKPISRQELLLRIRNGFRLLRTESLEHLVFSMAKLADCRSPETGRHLERVRAYTLKIGQQLTSRTSGINLTDIDIHEISQVSPLHDIGKVGIPDHILNKKGKLNDKEFRVMQEHCKIGGDIIADILKKSGSRSLKYAFEITMYHHERWDGAGYPFNLAGEAIPISARIMAVADVYDALITKRIYKEQLSHKDSTQYIARNSGSHFDPVVVEAFIDAENKIHDIALSLSS